MTGGLCGQPIPMFDGYAAFMKACREEIEK